MSGFSLFELKLTKERLLKKLIHKMETKKKVLPWQITDCMKDILTIDRIMINEEVLDKYDHWKKNRFLDKAA